MAEGLWLLTPRGRAWISIDGFGSAYQGIVDQYRQNLKNVREYPTKPSIQELLLASLPTLKVMPEEIVRKELSEYLTDWQEKRNNKYGVKPSPMPNFPRMFEGGRDQIVETLYRQMLNDNSSDFKNLVISIPNDVQNSIWLDVHVSYQNSDEGFGYGHLVGRYQSNSYILITSRVLF